MTHHSATPPRKPRGYDFSKERAGGRCHGSGIGRVQGEPWNGDLAKGRTLTIDTLPDVLFSLNALAYTVGVSERTAWRRLRAGTFPPPHRRGKPHMFSAREALLFFESHDPGAALALAEFLGSRYAGQLERERLDAAGLQWNTAWRHL